MARDSGKKGPLEQNSASALQPPSSPNPVVYRILREKQAALPTAGRYPNSTIRRILQKVAGTGREPPPKTSGKPGFLERGGAESGAHGARPAEADPDLARVVAAWPALPEATRRAILTLAETAEGMPDRQPPPQNGEAI